MIVHSTTQRQRRRFGDLKKVRDKVLIFSWEPKEIRSDYVGSALASIPFRKRDFERPFPDDRSTAESRMAREETVDGQGVVV